MDIPSEASVAEFAMMAGWRFVGIIGGSAVASLLAYYASTQQNVSERAQWWLRRSWILLGFLAVPFAFYDQWTVERTERRAMAQRVADSSPRFTPQGEGQVLHMFKPDITPGSLFFVACAFVNAGTPSIAQRFVFHIRSANLNLDVPAVSITDGLIELLFEEPEEKKMLSKYGIRPDTDLSRITADKALEKGHRANGWLMFPYVENIAGLLNVVPGLKMHVTFEDALGVEYKIEGRWIVPRLMGAQS